MSDAYRVRLSGVVALVVVVGVVTVQGAMRPRDPNAAASRRKPAATQAAKPVSNTANTPKSVSPARITNTANNANATKPVDTTNTANTTINTKAANVASTQAARPPLENPATFTPDMTLGRAMEILRNCTYPPVNIVVIWRDLESKANITRETPIGLDGLSGLRIRQYLDMLVRSISAGSDAEVGYALDGGAVVIATKESLPKAKLETRVYDISDLAAPTSAAGYMGMGMGTPYGGYGTGTGYNGYGTGMGYSPGVGYNSGYNSVGYPGSTNGSTGRVMLGGS
jgi:hypothetical protein